MVAVDLRIEQIRMSKHWRERHRRMKALQMTATNSLLRPRSSTSTVHNQTMDVELWEAAKAGDVENFLTCLERFTRKTQIPLATTFSQLTDPDRETFLHVAARYGHEELTGFITDHFRKLIPCKNPRGDSALHLAAREGHYAVVEIITRFRNDELDRDYEDDCLVIPEEEDDCLVIPEEEDDCLVITEEERVALKQRLADRVAVNDQGNTALHEALLNHHRDVAEYLIRENVEAAYYVNKQGKSPLYMAVEAGNTEYVNNILNGRSKCMHLLNEQLTNGKSLLHAAIMGRNIEILQRITEKKPMLINIKNEEGLDPLEFASSIGFLEGVYLLQDRLKETTSDHGVANLLQDRLKMNASDQAELHPVEFTSSSSPIDFLQEANLLNDGLKETTSDHGVANVNNEHHKKPPELRIEDIRQSEHWEGRHERLNRLLNAEKVKYSNEGPQHGSNPHSMNLALYIAAKKGDIDGFMDALDSPVSLIYNQMTPLKNTVLHVAASYGNEDLAGFLVHHFRSLLNRRNHRGDTALHMAAIAGHLGVVDVLVRFQIDQMRKDSLLDVDVEKNNETLIGKFEERVVVNDDGNTPLHEALKNNHEKVAEYLIKANIEDAFYVNKQGESALYMAVEAQKTNFVKTISSTRLSYTDQHILDEEITKGKSLLHATIATKNTELLEEITKMKTEVIHVKDEYGQTPLHHAASLDFLEGLNFLLDKFKLDIFEKDAYGFYPIHCASKNGHVGILEKLLQHCPDAREFVNDDNQNILHVAALYGKDSVVRYILNTSELDLLLNEKDKDGNTPLHLATINWHPKVVSSLTWDKRVNLGLVNSEGLTALDVAEENVEAMTSYRQRLTWMALKSAGTKRAKLQNRPKLEKLKSTTSEPYNMDYSKDRVNTLLLVSTLIATVTFAAGFTMPGGYSNSEPDQGLATLLNKLTFQVFVICDTIAMYSAILVAVSLIWAQLGDLTLVLNALKLAIPLLGISLTMMSLAFMGGVYLVVSKLVWLANVVLIVGIISLACLLSLFIPLNLPYTSTFLILRYISYYPFCLLMFASGSYYDPDVEHNSF